MHRTMVTWRQGFWGAVLAFLVGGLPAGVAQQKAEKQVLVQATVAEISPTLVPSIVKRMGQGPENRAARAPTLVDNGDLYQFLVQQREKGLVKFAAEPNLVAINGQTACFQVGAQLPVPFKNNVPASNPVEVQYIPIGIQLSITPLILDEARIRLNLQANINACEQNTAVGGTENPSLVTRNFQTTVELREGQTFALASLDPLGQSKAKPLVVFLTPRLVHPETKGAAAQPRPQTNASRDARLAVLKNEIAQAEAEDRESRPTSVIVSQGGTTRQQMKSRKPIKTVTTKSKENAITICQVQDDPTTLLIAGKKLGGCQIEVSDADGRKETWEIIVQLDPEYLKTQIRRAVPTANVTPIATSNNAIALTGTVARPEDLDAILRLAQGWEGVQVSNAMQVGSVHQVQLDIVFVEVNAPGSQAFSEWIGSSSTLSKTHLPFFFGATDKGREVVQFVESLKKIGQAKILAQPSLVTLSGRPATFQVGGEQAVPVAKGSDKPANGEHEFFGIQVNFLPIVLDNGKIRLEVSPSLSLVEGTFGTDLAGKPAPGRRRLSLNTTVELMPDQTFIIKMPDNSGTEKKKETFVLMTPHLIDTQDSNRSAPGKKPTAAPSDPLQAPVLHQRHYIPAYQNSPPAETLEDRLETIVRKLEQLEKRLDAQQKRREESLLRQAEKMLERIEELERRLESSPGNEMPRRNLPRAEVQTR